MRKYIVVCDICGKEQDEIASMQLALPTRFYEIGVTDVNAERWSHQICADCYKAAKESLQAMAAHVTDALTVIEGALKLEKEGR